MAAIVTAVVGGVAGLTLAVAVPAGAAATTTPPSSAGMRIEAGPVLAPSSVVVRTGGTVVVTNVTGAVFQVQIGSAYVVVLLPGEAADGAGADPPPFTPSSPGRYPVTASRPGQSASGVVEAVSPTSTAPSPAPSPSAAGSSAAPAPSASAPPGTAASSAPAHGSRSTPAPARSARTRSGHRSRTGALPSLPPSLFPSGGAVLGPPGPPAAPPTLAGNTPVIGGPLQTLGLVGGGVALPAAVALVLLCGVIGGLLRVLLAQVPPG